MDHLRLRQAWSLGHASSLQALLYLLLLLSPSKKSCYATQTPPLSRLYNALNCYKVQPFPRERHGMISS